MQAEGGDLSGRSRLRRLCGAPLAQHVESRIERTPRDEDGRHEPVGQRQSGAERQRGARRAHPIPAPAHVRQAQLMPPLRRPGGHRLPGRRSRVVTLAVQMQRKRQHAPRFSRCRVERSPLARVLHRERQRVAIARGLDVRRLERQRTGEAQPDVRRRVVRLRVQHVRECLPGAMDRVAREGVEIASPLDKRPEWPQRVLSSGVGPHAHAALDRGGEPVAAIRYGFDVARAAGCLPKALAQPGHRLVETVVADGDRAPPGFDQRRFRHDLPRVCDEPEQDGGLWIGQPHARRAPKQAAAAGIELERAEALHDRSAGHAVRGLSRPACVLDPRTPEKLCTSGTPDVGGRKKVCKTGAETAWRTRETCRRRPATAKVSPATPETTSATCRVRSPTPAPRRVTYRVRPGNGQQVPGNAPEHVGNVPSAISHTRAASRNVPTTIG